MPLALSRLARDLRMGVRSLARRPALLTLCAATLAVGFAGNMTVFSLLDTLLLRPYPFPDLEKLVLVSEVRAGSSQEQLRVTPGDFLDLSQEVGSFEGVAAFRYAEMNFGEKGSLESVRGYAVTANLFPLVGVEAREGRTFAPGEGGTEGARVALLSHGLAKRRFATHPGLVGSEIVLNGERHEVVGLMPENLNYPRAVDVFVPLVLGAAERVERGVPNLSVLARRAPGVSLEEAAAELDLFSRKLAARYPASHRERSFRLSRLREEQYRYTLPMFSMLQIAGLLALLLAAANASNLVLVWRMARSREIAVRAALGAGRGRLWRQALFECLALSAAAMVLAVPLAFWAVELTRDAMPQGIATWVSGWRDIGLRRNSILLGLATAAAVAAAMSAAGTSRFGSRPFSAMLQGGGRGTAGLGSTRLRGVLAAVQIGLALLLLSCAVWLVRGFEEQMRLFDRIEPRGVLTARVSLSRDRFPDERDLQNYFARALDAFAGLPGVTEVGAAANLPASNVPNEGVFFEVEGLQPATSADIPRADLQTIAGDFLGVFRVGIVRGRGLLSSDDIGAPRVVLVSETWARRNLGSDEALGRRLRFGRREPEGPWWTIVGLVPDLKQNWFDPEPRPILYVSHLQSARSRMSFALRSERDGYALAEALQRKLGEIDPDQALAEPKTMEDEIADSLAPIRIIGRLLLAFAGVALLLAVTGVYGVVATSVAERTREIGLRVALGARPRQVLKHVLSDTLRLAATAVIVALPATYGINVLLAGRLFGVVVVSPGLLALIGLLLLIVAAAAASLPARGAARVDPVRALRWE
ncbi:MAG TPA: ADOP family duplicated permease [Vicinamibacteria bacterium]|nr:ADOP family duplicated permease [Vicinamibacteria bacterium]